MTQRANSVHSPTQEDVRRAIADRLIGAAGGAEGPVVGSVDGRRVHVEVAGAPRADDAFAAVVSTALKRRQAHPHDRVVVALPDVSRYRTLHAERAEPLHRAGIEVWLVTPSGAVDEVGTAELPDRVVATDTAAQRRHRAHQSRWRRDILGLPAGEPPERVRRTYPTLGNYLPETHDGQRADAAGWNLMSDAARDYTRERLAVLRRAGGLAEPDRLWRNMLSSQPLAFSVAGHLRAHPAAAVAVFAELAGWPVTGLDRLGGLGDDHSLDGIEAEWSPPRERHTGDRSGFDLAAVLCLDGGGRGFVSIEVKYVDSFSPTRLDPAGYAEHLALTGIGADAATAIVAAGGSQFLRSVLLTESVRRNGIRGETRFDRALSVVLARADDPAADRAVRVLQQLAPQIGTARWSHGQLFAAAGRQDGLAEWARWMRRRYVPNEEGPC